MVSSLRTNILALRSERYLSRATEELSQVSEKLASGQRINRASDDAAGLAIATTLRTDSRVLSQSIRNLNDGISALGIAQGAAGELSSIVMRLKELSEQSANGTFSQSQRKSLNSEAQALRNEFNRTVATTSFNGIKLIDARTGQIRLEAGDTTLAGALFINGSNLNVGKSGNGTFSNSSVILGSGGSAANDAQFADLNEDGIADLVSNKGTALTVSLGNGDGSFRVAVSYAGVNASPFNPIRVGDVNGDGRADVIALGGSILNIFLSNQDGSLAFSSLATPGTLGDIEVGDANGDGILDIAYGSQTNLSTGVLYGNGNGTFRVGASFTGGGGVVSLVDLNSDGVLDLVGGITGDPSLHVALGNSNGTYAAIRDFVGVTATISDLEYGDFNGDGIFDLAAVDGTFGAVNILLGNGNGTFLARKSQNVGSNSIAVGDFNGDGRSDFATRSGIGVAEVYFGNGDNSFINGPSLGTAISNLAVGDANNDGVIDILAISTAVAGRVDLFLGNGDGMSFLNEFDISNRGGALASLTRLTNSHDGLLQTLGTIGAAQSRLSTALNSLRIMRDNYVGAESRIMDYDVAEGSSAYIRLQLLQKVGAAVLAQANQDPKIALSLIRG